MKSKALAMLGFASCALLAMQIGPAGSSDEGF
jgi:hypothetical protein